MLHQSVIGRKSGGTYIAGGFNKAKVDLGKPAVGNRYVIIRFEDEAAYDKFWTGGGKAGSKGTRQRLAN